DRCRFLGNHADGHGGALACAESTIELRNCEFVGNTSEGRGGAVYLYAGAWTPSTDATFVNCAFTENQADDDGDAQVDYPGGGAIFCEAASEAGYEGNQPLSLTVVNSIVWDNVAPYPTSAGPYFDYHQITEDDEDDAHDEITMTMSYSDYERVWYGGGANNIDGIPNFRDANGADDAWGTLDDDLRLGKNSPCFDRGDPDGGAGNYDLDGKNRIMSTSCYGNGVSSDATTVIDMGPYENQKFGIVYVDQTKTGGNNTGADWTNAYTDMQDALEAAEDPEVCEVWVADGTYKPDDCTNCNSADRQSTFEIPDHVGVYGGFEGTTDETDRKEDRSPSTDITTLTGLIGMTTTQRVYHVVTIPTAASTATILDGFTVKNGKADGSGTDEGIGGGALVKGDAQFKTCTFEYNKAKNGGAACLYGSAAYFIDCAMVNNDADDGSGGGSGGAIYVAGSHTAPVVFRRCNINNNESLGDGGAVYVADNSHWIQMTNCLFYQNEADKDDNGTEGGAIYTHEPIGLYNCTFARNQCGNDDDGGAIYLTHEDESSTIYNCIFWGNMTNAGASPTSEADQIKFAAGTVTAQYTCVQYYDANGPMGHLTNNGDDPLFKNATSDDYELDPANCGDHSCTSKSIDLGEDDLCNNDTGCSDFDVKRRTRKVDLDQRDDDIDRGAMETQSSP
ncbi:MAG: right-handed parallel beta-helix repeat-containing protein, partial [Phycisphaerales bacterium]|nr:right-handed parallel beta-helix repeat-containing protein [Phycisphaerales bacterium]